MSKLRLHQRRSDKGIVSSVQNVVLIIVILGSLVYLFVPMFRSALSQRMKSSLDGLSQGYLYTGE